MASIFERVLQVVREEGVSGVLSRIGRYVYRWAVRPLFLGGVPVQYAGLPISYDRKWGDNIVPSTWVPDLTDQPEYEAALASGLNEHVRAGDRVIVIGGGVGVTAVIAALRAGPSGRVECFEGSFEHVTHVRRTAARNNVANLVVHHAVVGQAIAVYGARSGGGPVLPPDKLPPCEVLELDCEGAEVQILRELRIRPRVILVETHGLFGAPTSLVASILEERGYTVSDLGWAEPRLYEVCRRDDIRVLLATTPV